MKKQGLRYRKVKHIANSANSNTSKIVRQNWALNFLKSDRQDRVYLNLDETWLGMSDFRRMKWQAPGSNNSVPAFQMAPRVSMFVACDTIGNVYLSLSQSNSNEQMMSLYLQQLVLKLDKERPDWRRNTIVTMDGASYHTAAGTLALINKLRIPVLMQGPHSYDVAPCELYFAAFKRDDINPRHVPTTKEHFPTVVDLVIKQCLRISKQHVVMNWHHCLKHVY
jgi:hypothetical protein